MKKIDKHAALTEQHNGMLAQIVKNSPVATFVIDTQHRVILWNRACEIITGVAASQIIGSTGAWQPFYPQERPVMADLIVEGRLNEMANYYAGKYRPSPTLQGTWEAEDFFPHFPDGGKWLTFTATELKDEKNRIIGAIETLRDVTVEKTAEAAWRDSQHLLHEIIDGSPVPMFVLNAQHQVTYWNRACEALNGTMAKEMIGTRLQWKAFYPNERPVLADLIVDGKTEEISKQYQNICRPSLLIENAWEATTYFPDFQSGPKWLYFTAAPLHSLDGQIVGAVETLQDVTAQKKYEQQLEYKANYDTLTGLANRNLLNNRLRQAIIQAQRGNLLLAVLFLDLDNFKQINDTLGHSAGDEVIQAFGQRISGAVRDVDTVARISGDEYVVLLHAPQSVGHITTVVRRLLDQVEAKLQIRGRELYIGCSVGIALYPKDGDNPESLMMNADAAMYRAKASDKGGFRYYSDDFNKGAILWMELKQQLHYALTSGQLELYYQPQYSVQTKRITGAEALLRWNHPSKGLLLPDVFIPIAEETGLIIPIGNWVVRTAITEAQQWQEVLGSALRLSVNISARQFRYKSLLELLDRVVDHTGFAPLNLELELTESLVMNNPDKVNALLKKIKSKGFSLAMDDFGTGYSSLAYLRRFPFDMVKIDQSFIADLGQNTEAEAIVRAMLTLGKALGLRMVAEGVETEAQWNFLRAEGCDEIQGFWFSRPLCASDFMELLKAQGQVKT
ncbi:MAG: EAL domain-containing protein [Desulfobulbaceae bacterium]|nr:EAL domain-containing protein [Desulfobulbaceae bacterium]